jgi:hypothetical protein
MEELLKTLIGKKIDAFCGGTSSVRGEVMKVENGVLHLQDEEKETCFVAIHLIVAVWERGEKDHHAGFLKRS